MSNIRAIYKEEEGPTFIFTIDETKYNGSSMSDLAKYLRNWLFSECGNPVQVTPSTRLSLKFGNSHELLIHFTKIGFADFCIENSLTSISHKIYRLCEMDFNNILETSISMYEQSYPKVERK